jgi:HSP20 family protein
MNLTPWSRRGTIERRRGEFDDFFHRVLHIEPGARFPSLFQRPSVHVVETDKAWKYTLDLPGLNEKDIEVHLRGREITVKAERMWEETSHDKNFPRLETGSRSVLRTLVLPENARTGTVAASYRLGVLEITVDKAEPTPAIQIPIHREPKSNRDPGVPG